MARRIVFDQVAPVYDLGFWFLSLFFGGEGRVRQGVIDAARPLEGSKVLEVCAGTGALSLMAAEMGASVTAVDIGMGMLKVAGAKSARAGRRVDLVRADASVLPFGTGVFDRVIVSLGLHEAGPELVPLMLAESHRVLKDEGRLVIYDFHGADGGVGVVQRTLFHFIEGDEVWPWLKYDMQGLLNKAGFTGFRRQFSLKRAMQLITVQKGSGKERR